MSRRSASARAHALGLDSRSAAKAEAAEQAVRERGPEAVPFLLQVIQEQEQTLRKQFRILSGFGSRLLLTLFVILSYRVAAWTWPLSLLLGFSLAFLPGLVYVWKPRIVPFRLLLAAKALLLQLADKEHIGCLVDQMAYIQFETGQEVDRALARLLPQLRASDAGLLLPRHRKILAEKVSYRYLLSGPGVEFTVALLRALQQVGDGSFLEPVRKLARMEHYQRHTRVQEAAEKCLPYLEAFAAQEQKSGTLVRAASAPDSEQASALLLRPAATNPGTEPTALLRPAGQEEVK